MDLLTLTTGLGLAAGAGGRAMIVALALGGFHYTAYFTLGSNFEWLAAPPVMAVLGVLAAVELLADWYPSFGELNDLSAYAPKAVAGFIALAAATGRVDDSLLALLGSGVLGAGTAASVHWGRTRIRRTTRDLGALFDRGASAAETTAAAGLTGAAFLQPILVPFLLVALCTGGWFALKLLRRGRESLFEDGPFERPESDSDGGFSR